MVIREYQDGDEEVVAELWRNVLGYAEAHNDPLVSIRRKREFEDRLFFVAVEGSRVCGAVMAGYDGHRGWIYSLAVDRNHRRKGIGTALCRKVEQALRELECPKINLQVHATNTDVLSFYEKSGYSTEQRISLGKRLDELST